MSSTVRLLASLTLAATLGACASTPAPDQVVDARLSTEQFAAKVVTQPNEVRLAVHAQGLSPTQAAALAGFVDAWREDEGDLITVQTPTGGPQSAAAFRTGEGARGFLIDQGVPPDRIRVVGYDAHGQAAAPLLVGYLHHDVDLPRCGQAWDNIAHSADNRVQSNFGCAVTANIAAQIANPADLAGPRTMTPADATRRAVVLDKYRKGEITSSAKDEQAKGSVSETVK